MKPSAIRTWEEMSVQEIYLKCIKILECYWELMSIELETWWFVWKLITVLDPPDNERVSKNWVSCHCISKNML